MPMLASPSPEVLIAAVAARTTGLRVGSGGVMLPHYSPFKVAETFSMLSGLFPGPDRPGARARAGQRLRDDGRPAARPPPAAARRLPGAARRVARAARGSHPAGASAGPPHPAAREARDAGGVAARLVGAERGVGGGARPPVRLRRLHQPRRAPSSPGRTAGASSRPAACPRPHVAVAVSVICADDGEEAERLASSTRMAFVLLRSGRPIEVPPVDQALRFLDGAVDAGRARRPPADRGRPGGGPRRDRGRCRRLRRRRGAGGDDHARPRRQAPLVRARRGGLRSRRSDGLNRAGVGILEP